MKGKKYTLLILLFLAVMICSSCSIFTEETVVRETGEYERKTFQTGPPPHAPAHGYRRKHSDGTILIFDSGMDVYIVKDHPGHYFDKGSYYRQKNGRWEKAQKVRGPWKEIKTKSLPPGLRRGTNNMEPGDKGKKNKLKSPGKPQKSKRRK